MKKTALLSILTILIATTIIMGREVFGWLQYGNSAYNLSNSALSKTFIQDGISTISLQYWNVKQDGSIPYISTEENSSRIVEWVKWAHDNNKKAFMTIAAFSAGLAHNWNPQIQNSLINNRATLIKNVMDTVEHYGFDGVDIDFEATWVIGDSEGKKELDTLVYELSTLLKAKNLELSICTFGGREWNFPNLSDINRWQGKIDYINIMGYGETSEYATNKELTYSNIIDYCVNTQGYDSSAINLGLPAWADNWHGKQLDVHLKDIRNIKGGVCIWDLKLNGGTAWQSTSNWAILKEIKEYAKENSAIVPVNIKTSTPYSSILKTSMNFLFLTRMMTNNYSYARIYNTKGSFITEIDMKNISVIDFSELNLYKGIKIIKLINRRN